MPKADALERITRSFSPAEKAVFVLCCLLLALGAGLLALKVSNLFTVEVPIRGGVLAEGIVGTPRFANPLLALSDADRDVAALVYSGLLKATPDGDLVPDLAERWSVSQSGLVYDFTLRSGARFQDGKAVTADDVLFTIQKARDPALKSPKRANWEGVAAEKVSDREVRLTLKQPYAPFLENATLGILPKHLWKNVSAEQFLFSPYNVAPIGSGPYRIVKTLNRGKSGAPAFYELAPFKGYELGEPYIKTIELRFYQNETELIAALKRGEVKSAATLTPEAAQGLLGGGARVLRTPLPRVFAVFFNQNQSAVLADKDVRMALDLAADKDELIAEALHGYGVAIDSPLPPNLLDEGGTAESGQAEKAKEKAARLLRAKALLDARGWKVNAETGVRERKSKKGKELETLSFSLTTGNVPELRESAELLASQWKKIGADVRVKVFESGDLNQNVIRPRKFDALLFGEVIGRDLDLFAFWHSSQRNDPGLNIAMYTNVKVDKALENSRRTEDENELRKDRRTITAEIGADIPAVFLYSPEFIYILPTSVKGVTLGHLTIPSERFLSVQSWYIATESVWKIFAPKEKMAND